MRRHLAIACALSATAFSGTVRADDDERFALTEAWKAECGSCHVAYPPQLLPAASWDAIFAGLGDHFGSDASLDPATATQLLAEARAHARGRAHGEPPLRITGTRWFRHEHDEVRASTWQQPSVGSAANCAACHAGAEDGDYEGHRIPRSPQ